MKLLPDTATQSRAVRWSIRAAIALVALYVVYVLAANVWLNTALGEWTVNRKPEKFQMHWSSGHTVWPGRVALTGVRMHGHVRRTAWHVESAHVEGRIALWPLLRKEVRVPIVRADEVTGGVDRAATELPVPSPRPGGWVLRFDHIVSDTLRKGTFAGLELTGHGRADVGFYKQLRGGPMELFPSTGGFDAARLQLGDRELLRNATLNADFAIARHRREEAPGIRKLLKTDAHLVLNGATSGVDINVSPQGDVGFAMVPGRGTAQVDIGIRAGQLVPGGHARWSMPVGGHDVHGVARQDRITLMLDVDDDLHVQVQAPPLAEGRLSMDADVRVKGRQIPLHDPRTLLPRTSGHVKADWHFSSLRWLGTFFPRATWLTLDGAGDVNADVRVIDGQLAAGSRIGVPSVDVSADVMGNRIRGRANADIRLDAGAQGQLQPHLQAQLQRFSVASVRAPAKSYVEGTDLKLTLDARDMPTKLGADTLGDQLTGRVVFNNAQVPDLRVYNAFLPRQHMRFDGGSGRLSGDLTIDTAGEVGSGQLRIAGQNARMHLAGVDLGGDVDITLPLRRVDLRTRAFNVDGVALSFRNLSFSEPGGETRSQWWAKANLSRARLDLGSQASAGGTADVTMRDVGFLLALFSRKKEYPNWVYKLVDAGQAQVDGRVQWRGDTLWLDRMEAHNQRFDLQARLRLQDHQKTGQLYARWGVLSVGVDLQGQRHAFHLIKAKQWYDAQPNLLK